MTSRDGKISSKEEDRRKRIMQKRSERGNERQRLGRLLFKYSGAERN
jgi:hypothetical protein